MKVKVNVSYMSYILPLVPCMEGWEGAYECIIAPLIIILASIQHTAALRLLLLIPQQRAVMEEPPDSSLHHTTSQHSCLY